MKKLRASTIRDVFDPVWQLISSNKFVSAKVVHLFDVQENWIARILALGLDYILLVFVTGLAKDLVFANWSFSLINYILLMGVISFLYFVITESIFGYTLGKRLFDLKVVTENGGKPSFKNVFIRNTSKIFFIYLIPDVLVSYFTANTLHRELSTKSHIQELKNGKAF